MKKIMILAMMALGVSSAFAGDSDALKSIMKAKTYAEAAQLLQNNLGQLQGNEEKAKAYDHLTKLALDDYNKQNSIEMMNQQYVQLKQDKNVQPFDTVAMYTALDNAMSAAFECDKYDQMPNAKGKVKPRFHESNATTLWNIRPSLINGGIYFQGKKNDANAYKFLGKYVDSASEPLFAEQDKSKDANLTNIAYFATIYAYQAKDYAKAERYVELAMKDPERSKEAANFQLAIFQAQLQTKADTLKYIDKLKAIIEKDPNNELVLGTLYSMYNAENMTTEADNLIENALKANPENTMALKAKGQGLLGKYEYDAAIEVFQKVLAKNPDDALTNTFVGAALNGKAQEASDRASKNGRIATAAQQQINKVWEEAASYLEKAKKADPNQQQARWAAQLYRTYYLLYGADDQRTKDAKADAGM